LLAELIDGKVTFGEVMDSIEAPSFGFHLVCSDSFLRVLGITINEQSEVDGIVGEARSGDGGLGVSL